MKGNIRYRLFIIFLMLVLSSLACNAPKPSPTPDVELIIAQTQTSSALEAWLTATAASPQTSPENQAPKETSIPIIVPPSPVLPAPTQTPSENQGSILVTQPAGPTSPTDLGNPDWVDSFDDKRNSFFLGANDDISFQKKDGDLQISALRPAGDLWRVAEMGSLSNFYLEAQFTTGNPCSGKDSYGLLFRAPDQANKIINTGYVVGLSCDGHYRFYRMDKGTYTGLHSWTAHPAILKGANQNNTLSVYAREALIQVYCNGIQLFEFSDSAYTSGYFGLFIRAETNSFTSLVHQIAFWRLP